jgi:hypothetical protein
MTQDMRESRRGERKREKEHKGKTEMCDISINKRLFYVIIKQSRGAWS